MMKDEIAIKALKHLESQARRLRLEIKKGKKLTWEDVKLLIIALGVLAQEVKKEVKKINWGWLIPLNAFIDWTKTIKLKDREEDK